MFYDISMKDAKQNPDWQSNDQFCYSSSINFCTRSALGKKILIEGVNDMLSTVLFS